MIINIFPDKEKAKSILKIIKQRKESLNALKKGDFSTIIAETYYEIIKELQTAILLVEGKKSVGEESHKNLIKEIEKREILNQQEINIVDILRIRRNKSSYYGEEISELYLKNNENKIKEIILKLEKELKRLI